MTDLRSVALTSADCDYLRALLEVDDGENVPSDVDLATLWTTLQTEPTTPTKIRKTVFQFVVLHPADEPLEDLEVAMYRADQDNAVGAEEVISVEDVPDDKVEAELIALGNDGAFFDHELGREED